MKKTNNGANLMELYNIIVNSINNYKNTNILEITVNNTNFALDILIVNNDVKQVYHTQHLLLSNRGDGLML